MIKQVRPDKGSRPEYVAAFSEIINRIARSLAAALNSASPNSTPAIRMYVAGGAAVHFYTGARVSRDIDATFSRRIALPENLEVSYRDGDGAARLLYLDRQYNDTLGLMHQDAYDESWPLELKGLDSHAIEVRLLSPLDLAVSKLGRFSSQDREDIVALARHNLIEAGALRRRAEDALLDYVGDTGRVKGAIDSAARLVADAAKRTGPLAELR